MVDHHGRLVAAPDTIPLDVVDAVVSDITVVMDIDK